MQGNDSGWTILAISQINHGFCYKTLQKHIRHVRLNVRYYFLYRVIRQNVNVLLRFLVKMLPWSDSTSNTSNYSSGDRLHHWCRDQRSNDYGVYRGDEEFRKKTSAAKKQYHFCNQISNLDFFPYNSEFDRRNSIYRLTVSQALINLEQMLAVRVVPEILISRLKCIVGTIAE